MASLLSGFYNIIILFSLYIYIYVFFCVCVWCISTTLVFDLCVQLRKLLSSHQTNMLNGIMALLIYVCPLGRTHSSRFKWLHMYVSIENPPEIYLLNTATRWVLVYSVENDKKIIIIVKFENDVTFGVFRIADSHLIWFIPILQFDDSRN